MDNRQTTGTRVCDQCHKEVAEVNFDLHESHCSRFLTLCPDCDEPVPKGSMDTHRSEQHTQMTCVLCKQKVERCRLADHESDKCEMRLVCCRYCQLAVPWRSLEGHVVACGSRTERCDDCGRYVTLKDHPEHAGTCSGIYSAGSDSRKAGKDTAEAVYGTFVRKVPPKQTTRGAPVNLPVSCLKCQMPFSAARIGKHELECTATFGEEEEEEEEEEVPGATLEYNIRQRYSSVIESLKGASFSGQPREERVVGGASSSDRPRAEWVVGEASSSDRPREEQVVGEASSSDQPREEQVVGEASSSDQPREDQVSGGASFSDLHGYLKEQIFGGDHDQIRACPHCHLALPLDTLRKHQSKCQIHVNLK